MPVIGTTARQERQQWLGNKHLEQRRGKQSTTKLIYDTAKRTEAYY